MTEDLRRHIGELLRERADRVGTGDMSERTPLELVVRGESLSARLYPRYNQTWVLALDVYVDDVVETPSLAHWVATRSGVMPFATLHIHRPLDDAGASGSSAVLLVSHTMVAASVDGAQLDEVLDSLTYMARRARGRLEELGRDDGDEHAVDRSDGADDPGTDDPDAAPHEPSTDDGFDDPDDAQEAPPAVAPPRARLARPRDEILAELDGLVGLAGVKHRVAELVVDREVAQRRRDRGLAAVVQSPHLVFTGNPGTGKTTVARLVGELYRSIGLLPRGHLVETDRAGLVAGYVGQTALKTRAVCERALGGVLFIDEAYSLLGGDRDYGHEAIETLLAFMENHRNEFAVVVAGYPAEMQRFIESNPGLRSRFDITIDFPDYSSTELLQMLNDLATAHDYTFTPDAFAAAQRFIRSWPRHRGFGNGREVRKLFNDIVRRHSTIVAAGRLDSSALCTIPVEAVPTPLQNTSPVGHPGYL